MSDQAQLAAGTIAKFSTALDVPVYDKIMKGLLSLGAIGEIAEAKERTVLADTTKKYGAGMKDAPDKTLKLQRYDLDLDQNALLTAADNNDTIMVEITFPLPKGAATPAKAVMEFKLLGYELDDVTGEDWRMVTISAKQNSIEWTDATAS